MLRRLAILGLMLAAGGLAAVPAPAAPAANTTTEAGPGAKIDAQAASALKRMGESLKARRFSFQAQTIRVYTDQTGQPLHIFHRLNVVVDRPNRLLVERNGDDGASKIFYDGKTVSVYVKNGNRYASMAAPDTILAMMKEVMGRLGVDFPLADFLTEAPDQAFLSGVSTGRVVGTVTIGGAPTLHLFFTQPPGIDLELWLEKDGKSLPRRLIVTYRDLPGQPSFIALFSAWNFSIHPAASEFVFTPPPGAQKVALAPPAAPSAAPPAKLEGGAR